MLLLKDLLEQKMKFTEKTDLANWRSNVYKLDIDKLILTNLSNLKSNVDKLDVDKLVTVPVDLSRLRDVVKNDFVRKDVFHTKIKDIENKIPNTTTLASKATLNAKINEIKGEIPNINNFATSVSLNAKINRFKGEIPSITNLANTSALTTVENKTASVTNFVQKTDYNTKINEMD